MAQILKTAGGHRLFEITSSNFLARKRRIEVEVRKAIEEGIKNVTRETGYGFHNESKLIARWLKKRNEPLLWGILKDELPAFLKNPGLSTLSILDHHDLDREILTPRNLQSIPIAQGECLCLAQIAPA